MQACGGLSGTCLHELGLKSSMMGVAQTAALHYITSDQIRSYSITVYYGRLLCFAFVAGVHMGWLLPVTIVLFWVMEFGVCRGGTVL